MAAERPDFHSHQELFIMATAAQIEANRLNATHSTGPRTEEGKARSRFNGLKDGTRSTMPVHPNESPDEWLAYRDDFVQNLAPKDTRQAEIAAEAALLAWRLKRVSHRLGELEALELGDENEPFMSDDEGFGMNTASEHMNGHAPSTNGDHMNGHAPSTNGDHMNGHAPSTNGDHINRIANGEKPVASGKREVDRMDRIEKLARHEAHLSRQLDKHEARLRLAKKDHIAVQYEELTVKQDELKAKCEEADRDTKEFHDFWSAEVSWMMAASRSRSTRRGPRTGSERRPRIGTRAFSRTVAAGLIFLSKKFGPRTRKEVDSD
jgi:hypothetical protein